MKFTVQFTAALPPFADDTGLHRAFLRRVPVRGWGAFAMFAALVAVLCTHPTLATPAAAKIGKVTLTALGSASHAQNFGQHFISLKFTAANGALTVSTPANAYLCPPGYQLLWLIDTNGVPSVSKTIRLN